MKKIYHALQRSALFIGSAIVIYGLFMPSFTEELYGFISLDIILVSLFSFLAHRVRKEDNRNNIVMCILLMTALVLMVWFGPGLIALSSGEGFSQNFLKEMKFIFWHTASNLCFTVLVSIILSISRRSHYRMHIVH